MLATLSTLKELQFYKEAIVDLAWKAAMQKEFLALEANQTRGLVPLPKGKDQYLASGLRRHARRKKHMIILDLPGDHNMCT